MRILQPMGKLVRSCGLSLLLAGGLSQSVAEPGNVDQDIAVIQAIRGEGQGNERARLAVRQLEEAKGDVLLKILTAMDEANGLGLNWLRATADVIVDREIASGSELPMVSLGEFLLDVRHHPRARRYAYEPIARSAPDAAKRLLPGMINDPSVELRRDAVQRLMDDAKELENKGKAADATLVYRQALGAARDVDQIDSVAEGLTRLGRDVDLPKHFGFLMHWKVMGPFDNTDRRGFAEVFPPEKEIRMDAEYSGKEKTVSWQSLVTTDEYGMLDVNKAFGPLKETTAYAVTEFESDEALPVEFRLGCKNAWKIWLNGEFLFGRDEYHRGARIDQYRIRGQLKAGKNTILVKVCQNEQMEDWTVEWQFQLRVCDETGTAILASNRLPTPVAEVTKRR